jgi:beta-galactosidase
MIEPEHAKALAYYNHPFFGQWAAITENSLGGGTLTYEGTWLSDALQKSVLLNVLKEAGLTNSDQDLPSAVRVKHGINGFGKPVHYYLNYGGSETSFSYDYASGKDLLTNNPINHGQKITLKPWDLLIAVE